MPVTGPLSSMSGPYVVRCHTMAIPRRDTCTVGSCEGPARGCERGRSDLVGLRAAGHVAQRCGACQLACVKCVRNPRYLSPQHDHRSLRQEPGSASPVTSAWTCVGAMPVQRAQKPRPRRPRQGSRAAPSHIPGQRQPAGRTRGSPLLGHPAGASEPPFTRPWGSEPTLLGRCEHSDTGHPVPDTSPVVLDSPGQFWTTD